MNKLTEERIGNLAAFGRKLIDNPGLEAAIERASAANSWFTKEFCREAIHSIIAEMLDEQKLYIWLNEYRLPEGVSTETIALILAGNLPLVGFHDFLCTYISGHNAQIKLSAKDNVLFPFLLDVFSGIDSNILNRFRVVDQLKGFDKVIATGSDSSRNYFEYYFRDYPRLLRGHRNSVAILSGMETNDELKALADDVFMYFGLGCRNVSKLYLPKDFEPSRLFKHFNHYNWMYEHTRYMNNYDYQRTILLLNKTPHFANEFVMLQENNLIASPPSVVFYEYYNDLADLAELLEIKRNAVQCMVAGLNVMVGKDNSKKVGFGKTQKPSLWDYPDEKDTLKFVCC